MAVQRTLILRKTHYPKPRSARAERRVSERKFGYVDSRWQSKSAPQLIALIVFMIISMYFLLLFVKFYVL